MSTRMLQRRGLASEWAATNPILGEGEIGFVKDTGELRIGDGVTAFEALTSPYVTNAVFATAYSPTHPPPYPVTSVAGRGGAVVLTAADVAGAYSAATPPPYPITSVAGRGGAVVLTAADIVPGTFRAGVYIFAGAASVVAGDGTVPAALKINASANGGKTLDFQSAGLSRWKVQVIGNEIGSNAGSDYTIQRYSDAGALLDTPFTISRVDGTIRGLSTQAIAFGYHADPAATGAYLQFNPSTSLSGAVGLFTRSATNKGLVLRGSASQTADLISIENSGGGQLGAIDSNGGAFHTAAYIGSRVSYGTLTVTPGGSGIIGQVIRGVASQSADLFSLQSSDGITHLSLRANGDIVSTGTITLNGQTQGIEHGAQGVSNSPFFDWHSSATANDYDVRMQAIGGTTLAGHGQLNITARLVQILGDGSTSNFAVSADASNGRGPEIALFDTKAGQATPNKFIRSMGGLLQVLNNAYTVSLMQVDDNGNLTAYNSVTSPIIVSSGMTGATAASRYAGATASGTPTTGTFNVGDWVVDRTGKIWVCTTAGSPGTWTQVGGGGSGGVAVKTATPFIGSGSTINLSGANPPNSSSYWQQIGNSVTITCGASGIIELDYVFLGYVANTGSYVTYITAAQSATDALSAYSSSTSGGVSSQSATGSGLPVNIHGKRVVSGLTPGTNYTFAVYGAADAASAIRYSSSSGNTPYPHNELTAITY